MNKIFIIAIEERLCLIVSLLSQVSDMCGQIKEKGRRKWKLW